MASHESPRTCALYLRVSSDVQTTANQRPDLVQLARARGLETIQVYEETGSAAKARPAFEKMWTDAHAGRFSHLLVWSLDRFGRSMSGNLSAVLELDRIGVSVVSVREPWLDTAGPVRSLLIAIFSWVAEQERTRIVERTKAGIERARRQGHRIGRPPASVNIATAVAMRSSGIAIREAARRLGVGASTLHRLLQAHDSLVAHGVPQSSALQRPATLTSVGVPEVAEIGDEPQAA